MKEHKIEKFITYMKQGYEFKLLPNYDNNGLQQKTINEIFYLFYNHEDDKLFFFDCEEDPMPENLKVELFSSRYLSKMNLCYALMRAPGDDSYTLVILNVGYNFLTHFSNTIGDYYDVLEYPWFKMDKDPDSDDSSKKEFVMLEEQDIFEDEKSMIEFITKTRPISIEDMIGEFKWNSYGDDLTDFFKSNPSLKEFSNLFRQRKIQNFLKSLD